MNILRSLTIVAIAFIVGAGAAFAQIPQPPQMPDIPASDDVSDEEVTQFVETIKDIEPLQLDAQEKIEVLVEAEGMSMERLQQVAMAQQNPQMAEEVDVTDEELETLQKLQPEIMGINMELQEQAGEVLEANGMTPQRFQLLSMAVEQDADLRGRVEALLDVEN